MLSMEKTFDSAEECKNYANELFKEHHFEKAIDYYGRAIEMNPNNAIYYSNRALAHIKMESFGGALADANKAIELDPSFIKAYYRRGIAAMSMQKFSDAVKDFKKVCVAIPTDADARAKLIEADKWAKKKAFEDAIAVPDDVQQSVSETLVLSDIIVESSYNGPSWEDGSISVNFVQELVEMYKSQKKLHKKYAYKILLEAKKLFECYPSLVHAQVPVDGHLTVCGDVHGQFYDLVNIFSINGFPAPNNAYLFNGDFVDRGSFSVEVIFTLLSYKLLYPDAFFLSRGNHETNSMNMMYGFQGEVKQKYSDEMYKLFGEVFNAIPIANVINDKIIVVHGGLFSKPGVKLEDIKNIDRFRQPGDSGLMCELLWSDPQSAPGIGPSKRGVAVQFGPDITEAFLKDNNLDLLIRSHEVKEEGYAIEHNGKCVTIFSAPNYCDSIGNKGAFIRIDPSLKLDYQQFEAVPHPNVPAMHYASPMLRGF